MLTKEKSFQNSENTTVLRISTPYRFPRTPCIPVTYHLKEAENIACAASGLSSGFSALPDFLQVKTASNYSDGQFTLAISRCV